MRMRGRAVVVLTLLAGVATLLSLLTACTSKGTKHDQLPVSAVCTGRTDVGPDVDVVRSRLKLLSVDAAVSSQGSTLTIRSKAQPSLTRLACGSFRSAVRPLIAAVKSAFVSSPTVPPISSFPATAAAYLALPEDEKNHLRARLAGADCSSLGGADGASPMLACQQSDGSSIVELLGPAIATSADVRAADVVSKPQWAWTIAYDGAATARLATYTSANNQSQQPSTTTNLEDCSVTGAPCATYLAFVVDGQAITTPATSAPLTGGVVQVSGNFTEGDARAYALRFGPNLPVPLTVH